MTACYIKGDFIYIYWLGSTVPNRIPNPFWLYTQTQLWQSTSTTPWEADHHDFVSLKRIVHQGFPASNCHRDSWRINLPWNRRPRHAAQAPSATSGVRSFLRQARIDNDTVVRLRKPAVSRLRLQWAR